jgi:hypothetical protein
VASAAAACPKLAFAVPAAGTRRSDGASEASPPLLGTCHEQGGGRRPPCRHASAVVPHSIVRNPGLGNNTQVRPPATVAPPNSSICMRCARKQSQRRSVCRQPVDLRALRQEVANVVPPVGGLAQALLQRQPGWTDEHSHYALRAIHEAIAVALSRPTGV